MIYLTGGKARTPCAVSGNSVEERIQRQQDHFKKLLTAKEPPVAKEVETVFEDLPKPHGSFMAEELKEAANQLKNGTASGEDEIPPELLKLQSIQKVLLPIINNIHHEENIPVYTLKSHIVPIYRKGDSSDSGNCKGIALKSLVAKLFNRLLLNRI